MKKYIIIILIIIIFIIVGFVIAFSESFNKKDEKNASKLKKFLEKKGWINELITPELLKQSNESGTTKVLKQSNDNYILKAIPIQCPGGACPGLGKGFYLPNININDPKQLLGGSKIFLNVNFSNGCQVFTPGGRIEKKLSTSDNTEDLVNRVAFESNIKGNISTKIASLATTLGFNTKYDIKKHNNIKTAKLTLLTENGNVTFQHGNIACRISNINVEFLSDFKRLPSKIDKPYLSTSWQPFYFFLSKWGSHLMTQITFGSKLEFWESDLDDSEDKTNSLEAKLCLNVDGKLPSVVGFGAELCSKYSKEKREEAKNIGSNSTTVIIGGNETTRNNLITRGINNTTVKQFLDSSSNSDQAISYSFIPIWEIILQVYQYNRCVRNITTGKYDSTDCLDLQRCLNLEAAYGFSSVKCNKLTSTNGEIYQEFRETGEAGGLNAYGCWNKKEGCTHTSTDCHFSGFGCKAYGPSAFDKGEKIGDNFKTSVRGSAEGTIREGINNSCNFSIKGCRCDKNWTGELTDRYIWDQGDI